jgi:hypothetical protein
MTISTMKPFIFILVRLSLILTLFAKCHTSKQDKIKYCKDFWSRNEQVYFDDKPIRNADPKTFECIKYEYSRDKNHVYFGERSIEGIDSQTFEVLEQGYSKDKNFVYCNYYSGKKIEGADPASFEVFGLSISKDKNNVYFFEGLEKIIKLDKADARTFHKFCDYFCDKNNLYNCEGQILADIRNRDESYIRELISCDDQKVESNNH